MVRNRAVSGTANGHDDVVVEQIESEELDKQSSPASYEILAYPADFTLEVLVEKWKKGAIKIPKFQRRFVWTQAQSSKLIESFLLGLPVPPIFLYVEPKTEKMLVVDGQQRLRSLAYFFEGTFGEEDRDGKRTAFRLVGLSEKSPYSGKTYKDIQETDDPSFRRLNDAVLRSFVIKQLKPDDHTSIYHIFERLNTGGTFLTGQEIRNCVYAGRFNSELGKLNKLPMWREIFGKPSEDRRQRDLELILRFLALHYDAPRYEKPMKDFLNTFMDRNRDPDRDRAHEFKDVFTRTADSVHAALGPKPFHIRAGINVAVYDSVFTAFAHNLGRIPRDVASRYKALLKNKQYLPLVTAATTDKDVVGKRLTLAEKVLFGGAKS